MKTFTITLGDVAENHKGMQKIGNKSNEGFNLEDLLMAKKYFDDKCETELIKLNTLIKDDSEDAYLLIARNGLKYILPEKYIVDDFFNEQDKLKKDTKCFMYGRVVNKHARYNLCFSEIGQEPNYDKGKGSIISYKDVPLLDYVIKKISDIIGEKGMNLKAEGNYYYDISKTGISPHGDSERLKVIGIRVGESLPLHFHWYHQCKPIGETLKLILNHGDIYFMSEKTTGFDWKKKSKITLRHCAGCDKYLKFE